MNAQESERIASPVQVLGPFVVVIAVLLGLCIGGFEVLSAVRAYVGGESLWSKARGAATAQLRVFADTGSPGAYARFLAALEVPLGDREAREALAAAVPDLERARAGFLRGGNHEDDVDEMMRLYRGFSATPLMRDAVSDWVDADRLIAEMVAEGQALAARMANGGLSEGEAIALSRRLDDLDERLMACEKHFSAALGLASRQTLLLLEAAVVALGLLMGLAVLAYASRALKRQDQSRQQLSDAHQRWTLAAAGAGIGLFEWRASDERYHFDARASGLLGLEAGPLGRDVEGHEWRARLHADDLPAVRAAVAQAQEDGAVFRVRYRVNGGQREERHLEAVGMVKHGESGRRARVLGILRDVSEEELHTRLSIDKAAAEQAARARMEFLSRLSHELRTPLNAVLGFSQLMLTEDADALSRTTAERVGHIHNAGKHLLHLVDDVLDVTRIDAGQLSVNIAPMPLWPVLQSALLQVETQREALGIMIDVECPSESVHVQADPVRLEQVFVNLLTNGCKYNRPGGRLQIVQRTEGDGLWVDFHDQGEGLADDEIDAIFQPFKRLTRHWHAQGTGLGLVIVKMLVAQMGGRIQVASAPGRGTTFSVRLARAG
jgi:signal transduction histidine kinase